MYGFETPPIKLHIEEISKKKVRLVICSVVSGCGQVHFPTILSWMLFSADPFGSNHTLSSPSLGCQPVLCAYLLLVR